MKYKYGGDYECWDREYIANKPIYDELFARSMLKKYDGNTESLEKAISEYTGRKYCVALSNATDALHFSLLSHGIGPGDKVMVTNFSWISSATCISFVGAEPIFCDIDIDSYHISFEEIKRLYTPDVKALIYTHLFGNMTDTTEIENFCKENNIAFIEDAAQSLGSSLHGRKAGTIGDCSSYSFNSNKVISGIAGGGMFMTDNEEQAVMVKKLRRHGKDKEFEILGRNSKMYVLNADVIEFRLTQMERWQKQRQKVAQIYESLFDELPIKTQKMHDGLNHNYHKYTIKFKNKKTRNFIIDTVKERCGFNLSIHYEKPISHNKIYDIMSNYNAKKVCDTIVSLPINPWLTDDEINSLGSLIALSVEGI